MFHISSSSQWIYFFFQFKIVLKEAYVINSGWDFIESVLAYLCFH